MPKTPILGRMNKRSLENMERERERIKKKEQKRIRRQLKSNLKQLENEFLPLLTVRKVPENLDHSRYEEEGKKVLQAYDFPPTNLGYMEGRVLFYDDGTAEIIISAAPWERISASLLKEIRFWGFGGSPFKINDNNDNYALFFSRKGVSVQVEKYAKMFSLLSSYFLWVYQAHVKEKTEKEEKIVNLSPDLSIKIERFLS